MELPSNVGDKQGKPSSQVTTGASGTAPPVESDCLAMGVKCLCVGTVRHQSSGALSSGDLTDGWVDLIRAEAPSAFLVPGVISPFYVTTEALIT